MPPALPTAGIPIFLGSIRSITRATAKDAVVWPDGKEKSVGLAISGIRASISAKGLGLATMFLRSRFVTITPKIRDKTAA